MQFLFIFRGRILTDLHRLTWNFAQPSGPRCPSILKSLTRIGATSRPCEAKNMILGRWIKTIPAVCRYAVILPVKMFWHDVVICMHTFRPIITFSAGRQRLKARRPMTAKNLWAGREEILLTHPQICCSPATNTAKRSNTIVVIVIIPVYAKWVLVTM